MFPLFHAPVPSGQDFLSFYPTGTEDFSQSHEAFSETYPFSFTSPPEPDDVSFSEPQESFPAYSGSVSESEENPEAMDKPEQTEELNYRETVRSVQLFMGWHHIPTFECDLSEPDKTNNPLKGKNPKRPSRILVAMLPDDLLCQKLEQLNCTVAEGYPSRSQDSAG